MNGKADLVLRQGKILTMDSANPEAESLAVKGEHIIAVGKDEDIMTIPEDEILSAKVVYTIIGGQVKHRAESP